MKIGSLLSSSPIDLLETEILISFVLKKDRSFIHAFPETKLTEIQFRQFKALLLRRARKEPLAYILGYKEFFGLKFLVDSSVLIPRAETENLVETALKYLSNLKNPTIVDVGTGSGCIAIAIAKSNPKVKIFATDISESALKTASRNAKMHRVSQRIRFSKSDLLENLTIKIDLILANLPYVPRKRWEKLPSEIRDFEPRAALDSGKSAKALYEKLFAQSKAKLKPDGRVLYEINGKIFEKSL